MGTSFSRILVVTFMAASTVSEAGTWFLIGRRNGEIPVDDSVKPLLGSDTFPSDSPLPDAHLGSGTPPDAARPITSDQTDQRGCCCAQ